MLVHKQDSLDIYVQIGDSLNTIATKSRDINIQLYKDSMLLDYQHKIDSMNNIIAANDSNQMILWGKYKTDWNLSDFWTSFTIVYA